MLEWNQQFRCLLACLHASPSQFEQHNLHTGPGQNHVEHRHCDLGGGVNLVALLGSTFCTPPPEDTALRSEAFSTGG